MLEAMREADRVAIGRVVLRQKGHVVALRPLDDVLTMETLVYADEIVAVESLGESGVEGVKVSKRELDVARQLVDMLSGPFDPDRFRDDYRDAVLAMIERKAAGEQISVAPAAPAPKAVPDLMAALQASIDAVGRHGDGDAGEAPAKPKRRARAASSSTARKPARKS